jgi:hypothetical protein
VNCQEENSTYCQNNKNISRVNFALPGEDYDTKWKGYGCFLLTRLSVNQQDANSKKQMTNNKQILNFNDQNFCKKTS